MIMTLAAVAALSASLAYWAIQLYKPKERPIQAAPQAVVIEPSADAAASLFGGNQVASAASNYQLTGVISSGAQGVAILIVDGQPAKAVKIGKEISPGVTVQEVHPRYVLLAENGVQKRVDLAPDTRPAADMSAPVAAQPMPSQPAVPPQQPPPPPNTSVPVPPGTPQEPPQPNQGQVQIPNAAPQAPVEAPVEAQSPVRQNQPTR
jgi:general secretion pathway protein C